MDVVPPTTRQNPLCQCKLCEFSRSHYKFSLGIAKSGNVLDLKKERGVYNLHVKVETGGAVDGSGGALDVSPNEPISRNNSTLGWYIQRHWYSPSAPVAGKYRKKCSTFCG